MSAVFALFLHEFLAFDFSSQQKGPKFLYNSNVYSAFLKKIARKKGEEGKNWEFGISRCKLLYKEWINQQVPTISTGNYIQCHCDKP